MSRRQPILPPPRPLAQQVLDGLVLVVRSLFWVVRWGSWAQQHFPDADDKAAARFARIRTFILLAAFVVAYTLYRRQQLQSPVQLVQTFFANLSWPAIFNNIAFIIVFYAIFAVLLRARWKPALRPVMALALPLGVLFVWFGIMRFTTVANPDGGGILKLLWAVAGFGVLAGVFGLGYTTYRAVTYRMAAHQLHPTMTPLMELALSIKALVVTAQSQATLFALPFLPSRLVALTLPVAAVIFYTGHAITTHRRYMRQRGEAFEHQIQRSWRNITRSQPLAQRWLSLSRAVRGQAVAFCIALSLLAALAILFPSGLVGI